MSLKSLVSTVLQSNGWSDPVTQVSSATDPNLKQAMSLANKALQSLCFSRNWPDLILPYTFNTVVGQDTYPLPTDYHHIIVQTLYLKDSYYKLKGNLRPDQWVQYQLNLVPFYTGYRIYPATKNFKIYPVPTSVQTMVFEYFTANLVVPSDTGANQPIYAQDDDRSILDEMLVEMGLTWRWRQKKGLDYSAEIAEYEGTIAQRYAQAIALDEIDIGRHWFVPAITDGYMGPNFNR